MNNPLEGAQKKVLLELEKLGPELGLTTKQIQKLNNQVITGMSSTFDKKNRRGGAGMNLGGEGTGLETFYVNLTGDNKKNIEFWHSFNEEAKKAWDKALATVRGKGAQMVEYGGKIGADVAKAFTKAEIQTLRKLEPELLQQATVSEKEISAARLKLAKLSGIQVAEMFTESEIQTLRKVYPKILTATTVSEKQLLRARLLIQKSQEPALIAQAVETQTKIEAAKTGIAMQGEQQRGLLGSLGKGKGGILGSLSGKIGMGAMVGSTLLSMFGGNSKTTEVANQSLMLGGMTQFLSINPYLKVAISLLPVLNSGIKYLMKSEKEHAENARATFKVSGDAIDMFGGKITDQSIKTHTFAKDIIRNTKEITQAQSDAEKIKNLDSKTSDLKKVSQSISGYNTSESVIGTVRQFAAAQVANGMDPAGVERMITAMLTYAGKTQYL
jgi:hypothetical protein